jgi:hypothetical protein
MDPNPVAQLLPRAAAIWIYGGELSVTNPDRAYCDLIACYGGTLRTDKHFLDASAGWVIQRRGISVNEAKAGQKEDEPALGYAASCQ